jgi:hypothetical protein
MAKQIKLQRESYLAAVAAAGAEHRRLSAADLRYEASQSTLANELALPAKLPEDRGEPAPTLGEIATVVAQIAQNLSAVVEHPVEDGASERKNGGATGADAWPD